MNSCLGFDGHSWEGGEPGDFHCSRADLTPEGSNGGAAAWFGTVKKAFHVAAFSGGCLCAWIQQHGEDVSAPSRLVVVAVWENVAHC